MVFPQTLSASIFSFAILFGSASCAGQDESQLKKAQLLVDRGDYAAAIEVTGALISSADPKKVDAEAYHLRAMAKSGMGYENPGEDSYFIGALEDHNEAISRNPNNELYLRMRADTFQMLGAYEETVRDLSNLETLEASNGVPMWSLVRMGGLKRIFGEYEEAIIFFDKAIANYAPTPVMPPNYHKAITLLKARNYDGAVLAINEGLKAQTNFAAAYEIRGCANAALGLYDAALTDFAKNDEIFSSYPEVVELPSGKYDKIMEAERLKYVEDLRDRLIDPDDDKVQNLCLKSWWQTHFDKARNRSELLPPA